jgi:hypothetical protein
MAFGGCDRVTKRLVLSGEAVVVQSGGGSGRVTEGRPIDRVPSQDLLALSKGFTPLTGAKENFGEVFAEDKIVWLSFHGATKDLDDRILHESIVSR